MSCSICSNVMQDCFKTEVLGKYQAQYEVCNSCGYIRARNPYWLDEAYSQPIANADTGLVSRNLAIARKVSCVLFWVLKNRSNARYLDVAGGYGMLTRLMRDLGFDFFWYDKYCKNLLACGFEYIPACGSCYVATAIEVLEHVEDPLSFIKEVFSFSGAETLIFTTELYEGNPPHPDSWWYYAFPTGQHIGFFRRNTLMAIADRLGMYFITANGIHIFSKNQLNKHVLSVVTGRLFSNVAPWWIRWRLGSKTMLDHNFMLNKINEVKP